MLARRPVRHPRPHQDVRQADPDRTRRRSARCARRFGTGELADLLHQPGALILVGERLASSPGATVRGDPTGRRDWRPARRGCRGAQANAARWRQAHCRTCCPVADPSPTQARERRHRVARLECGAGRDTAALPHDCRGTLLVGGVELADLPDPDAARLAPSTRRRSSSAWNYATARSPIAPTWCSPSHRSSRRAARSSTGKGANSTFRAALPAAAMPDLRVLYTIADEIGVELGLPDADDRRHRTWQARDMGRASTRRTVCTAC